MRIDPRPDRRPAEAELPEPFARPANTSRSLPHRDPNAFARMLSSLSDAERIAHSNVSPALVADLVRMALAPGGAR